MIETMDLFTYIWLDVIIVLVLGALPMAIVLIRLIRRRMRIDLDELTSHGSLALPMLLTGAVLVLVPATYIGARCRHDRGKLGEYLEQSRFGEARAIVRGPLMLGVQQEWNGQPLSKVVREIEQVIAALETRVARPLTAGATSEERLDRARQLAMLGRTEQALDVLASIHETDASPEVDNLRGTIHESQGDWDSGLAAFVRARAAWEERPPSDAKDAGLLRATMGVAYCQRKAGKYADAEATYQQLLALSPTADSHFLLAQFYDDAQHASKAREHARQAMALDPARYQQQADKLINKLAVYHFGCLGVFRAEGK